MATIRRAAWNAAGMHPRPLADRFGNIDSEMDDSTGMETRRLINDDNLDLGNSGGMVFNDDDFEYDVDADSGSQTTESGPAIDNSSPDLFRRRSKSNPA